MTGVPDIKSVVYRPDIDGLRALAIAPVDRVELNQLGALP
jgi:peptidoglycan/LPS O-acetylase OafA/YrhL